MDATGVNTLRGEFVATLAGEDLRFDTTLATVATMEDRCGGVAIVEAVNRAVFGRRAADHQALVAGALIAQGRRDAETLAARTSLAEAEAFILALMGALGFAVTRKARHETGAGAGAGDGAGTPPFPPAPTSGPSDGPDGAASRSAP